MNIALWIVQSLLAFAFLGAGFSKLATPHAELMNAGMGGWVADAPHALILFIGAAEVAGALGLILPGVTKIKPWLTPLAAAGLATVMLLAGITHLAYGEAGALPANLVLGALSAFVVWGRTATAARMAPAAA